MLAVPSGLLVSWLTAHWEETTESETTQAKEAQPGLTALTMTPEGTYNWKAGGIAVLKLESMERHNFQGLLDYGKNHNHDILVYI